MARQSYGRDVRGAASDAMISKRRRQRSSYGQFPLHQGRTSYGSDVKGARSDNEVSRRRAQKSTYGGKHERIRTADVAGARSDASIEKKRRAAPGYGETRKRVGGYKHYRRDARGRFA